MTTTPRWISQRRITWATDLPCARPISVSTGFVKMSFFPSANGPQDSIWTPRSTMSSWSTTRWWNGWVSIWSTAGTISLWSTRSTSRSGWKLETPMARATPSR